MEADAEINVSRSIFSRSRKDQRRTQRIMDSDKENSMNSFCFKTHPSPNGIPDVSETRPTPKSCDHCMKDLAMAPQDAKYLGLQDCFLPSTMSSYNPTFVRMFPFYHHYSEMSKRIKWHKLPTFKQLEDDDSLLSLYPEEMFDQPNMLTKTRNAILNEVRQLQVSSVWDSLSAAFFSFSAWICQKLLSFHFESVLVHQAEIEILRHINQTQLPIVYIPTFRSKWDKTLILWTLAHHGIHPPLSLASHLGKSRIGKYFGVIGSSMKVKTDDKHSELRYSSAFSVYLRHLLRNGNPLMVNLECRRSRTGRPSPEVYGSEILNIIYDEFISEKVEDVYFVPLSVSYEVLPEAKDILTSSSYGGTIFARVLKFYQWIVTPSPPKGKVRIDFAKPFCLREFCTSMKTNKKVQNRLNGEAESYCRSRDCAYLRWNSSESLNSVSSIYGELFPLYPDGNSDEDRSQALFLDVLNYHIMFETGKCESVMPTHLLAFLLMKKCRKGVCLDTLKNHMEWLKKFIESCKKDFGFAIRECDTESIIMQALDFLVGDVTCEWVEKQATFRIKPIAEIDSLRRLDYYANYIFPEFIMKAIIATAIFSMCGNQLDALRGYDQQVRLKDEEFMYHCRRIYEVFAGGFLLNPPCMTVQGAIRKEMNLMVDDCMLSLFYVSESADCTKTRLPFHWEDLSDDEDFYSGEGQGDQLGIVAQQDFTSAPDEIRIVTSTSTYDKLSFLKSLITPYLYIYAFLASTLKTLVDADQPRLSKEILMSKFQEMLLTKLRESENDFPDCRELLNKETVKAFLVSCEDHNIIYCRIESKTLFKFYGLEEGYNSEEKLDDLVNNITFYIK